MRGKRKNLKELLETRSFRLDRHAGLLPPAVLGQLFRACGVEVASSTPPEKAATPTRPAGTPKIRKGK